MKPIIIIAGPTAVGKTDLTIELAKLLQTEIISADSMQIYKGLIVGAATPTKQEQQGIVHHIMQCIEPTASYSVAEYAKQAKTIIKTLHSHNKTPIITGGTGLYVNSLLYKMDFSDAPQNTALRQELQAMLEAEGNIKLYSELKKFSPETASRIHPNNTKKVLRALEIAMTSGQNNDFKKDLVLETDYKVHLYILNRDRQKLYQRINQRVDLMVENGLVEEVETLLSQGLTKAHQSMQGIGYKETIDYIEQTLTKDEWLSKLKQNSRRYAKRQLTWFRRYQNATWIDVEKPEDVEKLIIECKNIANIKVASK